MQAISVYDLAEQNTLRKERGALFPQILLTFMLCLGTFFFGNIINWSEVGLEDMKTLKNSTENDNDDYVWLICAAPWGIAIGVVVWGFITRRIGPKRTLILTTPFLFISHFIKGYFHNYKIYNSSQVLSGFTVASYFLTGDVYLCECIHRRNLKMCNTFFRSSIMLGVLAMDICSTFIKKIWLCVGFGSLGVLYLIILIILPDSPHYLIQKSEVAAENSLKYYFGKSSVAPELNLVRQHLNIFRLNTTSNNHMLTSKVVVKAFLYIALTQFFTISTGYYMFLFDRVRIYKQTVHIISPYGDNMITGVVLLISKFTFIFLHLFEDFGIKIPIMISFGSSSIILFVMGTVEYFVTEEIFVPLKGTMFIVFSILIISYDIGLAICVDIMLYAYVPYQVYSFLKQVMFFIQWILIFAFTRAYMEVKFHWGLHAVEWTCAGLSAIGFIFVTMCVVETKGKSLTTIQMELGGNPIGTRGSTRQRISCPYESTADMYFLDNLIADDLAKNTKKMSRFKSLRKL